MAKTIGISVIFIIALFVASFFGLISFSPRAYAPILFTTSTLDFANTAAGSATDLTVTVTGAVDGDPVMVGIPNGATVGNGHFVGWVSSANTVTVRFLNNNLLAALNPASADFKILVMKK